MSTSRQVQVGEPFTLEVPLLETAGYEWQATFPPDELELISRERRLPGDAPGAPGAERFTFRALRPGTHVLRLEQRRAWEGAAAEVREERVEAR